MFLSCNDVTRALGALARSPYIAIAIAKVLRCALSGKSLHRPTLLVPSVRIMFLGSEVGPYPMHSKASTI